MSTRVAASVAVKTRESGSIFAEIRPAILVFLLLSVVTGALYPGVVTLVGQGLFAFQANGSILEQDGTRVGSALLGQPFSGSGYFWGRPSATGPAYNGGASSGSNQGATNPALLAAVRDRVAAARAADPRGRTPVPVDLVTASGSGLDPHISPAAAEYQVPRVARERGLTEDQVRALVSQYTSGRDLGILGEARVNVLELNLALDGGG
jgi:K+-transporting ATPase ATPase C chain